MNKVLYFTSPGCGVCVDLLPKVEHLVQEEFPKMQFERIDISESPKAAADHQVFAAPTVLVFFEGKETHRFVRNLALPDFESKLRRLYALYFS